MVHIMVLSTQAVHGTHNGAIYSSTKIPVVLLHLLNGPWSPDSLTWLKIKFLRTELFPMNPSLKFIPKHTSVIGELDGANYTYPYRLYYTYPYRL
jgi:hypothetical protein